jgi:hypothetical protein
VWDESHTGFVVIRIALDQKILRFIQRFGEIGNDQWLIFCARSLFVHNLGVSFLKTLTSACLFKPRQALVDLQLQQHQTLAAPAEANHALFIGYSKFGPTIA